MKIYVSHPGKQHSFQLAVALKKSNMLGLYITSVYNKRKSLTRLLLRFLTGDTYKKVYSRKCDFLDDYEVCQFNELRVILTLFLNKFPRFQKFSERWNFMTESSFYGKVINLVNKDNPNAVIVYNGYAKKHLENLTNRNIIKIMDVSIAERRYVQHILQKEIEDTGIQKIREQHFSYWDESMIKYDAESVSCCDYFLVPSTFVRNSLLSVGVKTSQIKVVPYGVDISQFSPSTENKDITKRLSLLYVGSVTYRKGMHRLLEVISHNIECDLYLAGTFDSQSDLYIKYKDNPKIHFLGFVTRDKLADLYKSCDIFVLPSFCEGMAMVGLEAMGSGFTHNMYNLHRS